MKEQTTVCSFFFLKREERGREGKRGEERGRIGKMFQLVIIVEDISASHIRGSATFVLRTFVALQHSSFGLHYLCQNFRRCAQNLSPETGK